MTKLLENLPNNFALEIFWAVQRRFQNVSLQCGDSLDDSGVRKLFSMGRGWETFSAETSKSVHKKKHRQSTAKFSIGGADGNVRFTDKISV